MSDNRKNIILRVDKEFHRELKIYVTMNNTTFQEYITNLIKKDLEQIKNTESEEV